MLLTMTTSNRQEHIAKLESALLDLQFSKLPNPTKSIWCLRVGNSVAVEVEYTEHWAQITRYTEYYIPGVGNVDGFSRIVLSAHDAAKTDWVQLLLQFSLDSIRDSSYKEVVAQQ